MDKTKAIMAAVSAIFFFSTTVKAQTANSLSQAIPEARSHFQDLKFGIFLHWGIYSMLADGEWVMWNRRIGRDEYAHLPAGFCPSLFNAEEWVEAFLDAGARYVTFTSRHHDGFSMFSSQATDYDIVDATPFGRDVVKELSDACRKGGMMLNLYYSHLDWHRTDYPMGVNSKELPHEESITDWNSYYRFMNRQLTELLTNYGPIGAIWFDGMWDHPDNFDWQLPGQYELIHSLQPGCLIGNNHHKAVNPGEDIQIFEQDLPGENSAGFSGGMQVSDNTPLETCQTMNNSWGYNITDKNYKSTGEIIRRIVKAAGMNANFLLNIGPRPDGKLPEEALLRLKELGVWMKQYGETIYDTRGGLVKPQPWGVSTQKDNRLFIHILDLDNQDLRLPIAGKNVVKAVMFKDGRPVKTEKRKQETILHLSEMPTETDCVIELTLKDRKRM
ncbi:MAG: alpha-L-fucosidase [Prevotella sp.]